MRALAFSLVFSVFVPRLAFAQDYCLALRGNGELAPAHWGAMANLVEKMGLPSAQSGGSSATLTLMLNEAIAGNPMILEKQGSERNMRAALLYKSLEGVLDYLSRTSEWRDFMLLYGNLQSASMSTWGQDLEQLLTQAAGMPQAAREDYVRQHLSAVQDSYRAGVRLGLLSPTNYQPLMAALGEISAGTVTPENLARAKFYVGELRKAISTFGHFDPKEDNLFFRPGIVDFAKFGEQVGRIAMFYSGLEVSPAEKLQWESFFDNCNSSGQTWAELTNFKRDCAQRFNGLLARNLKRQGATYADKMVGSTIRSLPTTSVLTASANLEARQGLRDYEKKLDPMFGKDFVLSQPRDVHFGYWGDPALLAKVDSKLPKSSDEKSSRFEALGPATWKQVLSVSPAEPGLSAIRPFTTSDGRDMVSAGGWSDLHPVTVLKAAGCSAVVYVTRRGGESPFAEGVARRLFTEANNPQAADEVLRRLYDLENSQSSMRLSLDQADAVLCTDWNRFDIKNGVRDLIKDSYRASPFFVRNRNAFPLVYLLPQLNPRDVQPDGHLTYEGCF